MHPQRKFEQKRPQVWAVQRRLKGLLHVSVSRALPRMRQWMNGPTRSSTAIRRHKQCALKIP